MTSETRTDAERPVVPEDQRVEPDVLPTEAIIEPPTSLFRMVRYLGPGLLLVAAIIGTGELVGTTALGAEEGYQFLWLILVSCFIKVIVQIELGRYAIVHGQTTLQAFHDLPGPRWRTSWMVWAWLLMTLTTLTQVGAMCGLIGQALTLSFPGAVPALADLVGGNSEAFRTYLTTHPDYFWGALTTILAMVLLVRGGFSGLLRVTAVLVALVTLMTVLCALGLALPGSEYPIDGEALLGGLTFSLPVGAAIFLAFSTYGITGVGSAELFAYPYWCIEKGYARFTGRRSADPDWYARARGWIRVMQYDAWFSMVVFTIATIAFYILGAAVLHNPQDPGSGTPDGPEMITELGKIYLPLGDWTQVAFLVGAWAILFSTIYSSTAANSRMTVDLLGLAQLIRLDHPGDRARWIRRVSISYLLVSISLYILVRSPVLLVIVGGVAQGLMLPLVSWATLYLSFRHGDKRVSSGLIGRSLLILAALTNSVTLFVVGQKVIDLLISS